MSALARWWRVFNAWMAGDLGGPAEPGVDCGSEGLDYFWRQEPDIETP